MKEKRKHNPKWKDSTTTQRQQNRREKLNEKAQAKGWKGISEYLTAILKDEIVIAEKRQV